MTVVAELFPFRKILPTLMTLVLLVPLPAFAVSPSVEFETMLYGFERDIPGEGSSQVLPGYGYLKFDLKNVTSTGISFHGYGWGRYDLADSNYYGSQSEGELLYGYLEYQKKFSSLKARLGRQHVFEGVANETFDGLWVAGKVSPNFSLSGYLGQAVGLTGVNGRSGDSLGGARLAYHGADRYDIGFSAKVSNNDGDTADRMVGVDLAWYLPKDMSLVGYSKFNAEESSFAEHSWELIIPIDTLILKPFAQYYDYDSYFATGAKARLPFRNLASSGETLAILGVDAAWNQSMNWQLGGKAKYYTYDDNDSSQYLGLNAVHRADEGRGQTGGEIGYMNGEAANNNYLLLRLYTYFDQLSERLPLDFITVDLLYALYDQTINGEDSSLFLSLGAGRQLFDQTLDLKLSGDYSSDPYYDSDLRLMLSATYYFGRGL